MSNKCAICKQTNVHTSASVINWLNCDGCKKWYHAACVGVLNQVDLDYLKSKDKWFCGDCIKNSNLNRVVTNLVKEGSKQLTTSNADIEDWVTKKLDEMWPQITDYCDKIKTELKEELATETKKLVNRIEMLEKELQQHNRKEEWQYKRVLMLYGIPDTINTYDHTFMLKIANDLGVENFNIDDVENVIKFPRKDGGARTSAVMVYFFKQLKRNNFMAAYIASMKTKKLLITCLDPSFPGTRIYINEYLPKHVGTVFAEAKGLVKSKRIHKANIRKGMVVITVADNDIPKIVKTLKDLEVYK